MLMLGDCIDKLKTLRDCSVDAVVTDPPYGLAFMGKKWDYDVPAVEVWAECLRVLKPGGHLLAFAGTRTQHRMAVRIEDAGFEIRDMIAWVYGSGFPKSLDVSKAIDKAAGAEREVLSERQTGWTGTLGGKSALGGLINHPDVRQVTAPATDAAKQWDGWGTALKPAMEPITVARKPLIGTVAENVLAHGTGGMNIEASGVPSDDGFEKAWDKPVSTNISAKGGKYISDGAKHTVDLGDYKPSGRWPANLIHDGSDEVVGLFPQQTSGANPTRRGSPKFRNAYGEFTGQEQCVSHRGIDSGSAARFFYCAKASKRDRDEGCEGLEIRQTIGGGGTNDPNGDDVCGKYGSVKSPARNHHPTVKPTDLMRYLCRLVTPPGGIVLDPFMGSGSTGKGAILEGFSFIGIERDPDYMQIAEARIKHATETAMNDSQTPSQLELEVASA